MSALAKRPLCGKCEAGYLYDETGDEPVITRCPCRYEPVSDGESERDAALGYTAEANPQAMRDALAIIRQHALTMPTFSSNDTRGDMYRKQIPGPIVGAAFRQAAKDRVIRRDGYVESTQRSTHMHPVVEWMSLIYRPQASADGAA